MHAERLLEGISLVLIAQAVFHLERGLTYKQTAKVTFLMVFVTV